MGQEKDGKPLYMEAVPGGLWWGRHHDRSGTKVHHGALFWISKSRKPVWDKSAQPMMDKLQPFSHQFRYRDDDIDFFRRNFDVRLQVRFGNIDQNCLSTSSLGNKAAAVATERRATRLAAARVQRAHRP